MNILDVIKNIPSGTFNYKKYKKNYNCKFNRDIDIITEYMAQLPYLKVVTCPLVLLFIFLEFSPIVIAVLFEHYLEKLKSVFK